MGRFELNGPEMVILKQAARTLDVVDRLDQDIRRAGIVDYKGAPRRVVVEHRQQSLTLARLLASLRIPDEQDVRPQFRHGSRGTYQVARKFRDAYTRELQARIASRRVDPA